MENKIFDSMTEVTKDNIWNFAQNKPTLIVRDIKSKYPYVDEDFIYEVLLKRGVFKWLAIRRELIKLKNCWKDEITKLNIQPKSAKEKGYLNALVRCRQEIRKMCHSDRWKAPDFDRHSINFLKKLESKEMK